MAEDRTLFLSPQGSGHRAQAGLSFGLQFLMVGAATDSDCTKTSIMEATETLACLLVDITCCPPLLIVDESWLINNFETISLAYLMRLDYGW